MKGFGRRLKLIRENKKMKDPKWTQEYVADAIGVARPTYTAYENGSKQPPLETVNKIADLFGVSVDYLLGRIDESAPKSAPTNGQHLSSSNEPLVEHIMRAREELSPKAYAKFLKLVEEAKKAFMDDIEEESKNQK